MFSFAVFFEALKAVSNMFRHKHVGGNCDGACFDVDFDTVLYPSNMLGGHRLLRPPKDSPGTATSRALRE